MLAKRKLRPSSLARLHFELVINWPGSAHGSQEAKDLPLATLPYLECSCFCWRVKHRRGDNMPLCSHLSPGGSDRRGDSCGWSCGAWGGGRSLLTGATYIRSNHFFIFSHTNQILLQSRSQMQIGHYKWLALRLWPPAWVLGPHILALGIFTFPSHSSEHPVVASQIRPVCLAPKIQNLLTENSHPLIIREGGAKGIHQHHAVYKLTMYLMV